jgi:hypothetical protein
VLAVRTSSGGVVLYKWRPNNWSELANLADPRRKSLESRWYNDFRTFDELKLRVSQLEATGKIILLLIINNH